jgi:hypothetical protein
MATPNMVMNYIGGQSDHDYGATRRTVGYLESI